MFILDAKDVQLKITAAQWLVVLNYVIRIIITTKKMKETNLLITLDVITLVILGIALFTGQFQVPVIIPILWIIVAHLRN